MRPHALSATLLPPAAAAAVALFVLMAVRVYVFTASFAKEPYKRDYILQKRLIILRSLLIVATP